MHCKLIALIRVSVSLIRGTHMQRNWRRAVRGLFGTAYGQTPELRERNTDNNRRLPPSFTQ